ncbi:MAG: PD40 domain-containing protein [Candidatus Eisenbacteria sp.]|nr:PD40 domain-containing protein [Candidatus Eisenbacteria bacterium]
MARYDLRYSMSLLTEADWSAAMPTDSGIVPKAAGLVETLTVADLPDGTWHFGLKTADEVPNWSEVSNSAGATIVDSAPPGPVTSLAASMTTMFSVQLTWISPGDDGQVGTASAYDLRYSAEAIDEQSWDRAARVQGVPPPQMAGSLESYVVPGLHQGTSYSFALKTIDNVGHSSDLSNVVVGRTARWQQLTFSHPGDSAQWTGVWEAAWSPDGSHIVMSASWGDSAYHADLYLISVNGGTPIRLTDEPGYARYPSWSPDGTQLAFVAPDMHKIDALWTMSPVPGSNAVIVTRGNPNVALADCAWAPDGDRIAYSVVQLVGTPGVPAYACISTVSVGSGAGQYLLCNYGVSGLNWSPDGSSIVFSSWYSQADIWVVPANGGVPQQLTFDSADDLSPTWSPRGSRIAFASDRSGNSEIWLMSVTGQDSIQLTSGPGEKGRPAWSPEGSALAVLSFENNTTDVWLVRWE